MDFFVVGNVISKKSGLNNKFKASTMDIQIKRLGLRVSYSKVFSSEEIKFKIWTTFLNNFLLKKTNGNRNVLRTNCRQLTLETSSFQS